MVNYLIISIKTTIKDKEYQFYYNFNQDTRALLPRKHVSSLSDYRGFPSRRYNPYNVHNRLDLHKPLYPQYKQTKHFGNVKLNPNKKGGFSSYSNSYFNNKYIALPSTVKTSSDIKTLVEKKLKERYSDKLLVIPSTNQGYKISSFNINSIKKETGENILYKHAKKYKKLIESIGEGFFQRRKPTDIIYIANVVYFLEHKDRHLQNKFDEFCIKNKKGLQSSMNTFMDTLDTLHHTYLIPKKVGDEISKSKPKSKPKSKSSTKVRDTPLHYTSKSSKGGKRKTRKNNKNKRHHREKRKTRKN